MEKKNKLLFIAGPVTEKSRPIAATSKKTLEAAGYAAESVYDVVPPGVGHDNAMLAVVRQIVMEEQPARTTPHRPVPRKRYGGVALVPGWEQCPDAAAQRIVAMLCGLKCMEVEEWAVAGSTARA